MAEAPIAGIELYHIALPTRREHKWTGLTEPIGGYVLVKMTDELGAEGWGEAPALKDWGGEFGRYFGESPGTTVEVVTRHLAPAVKECQPGEIVELHARMDHAIKGYPYAKAAVEFAAYDLAGKQCGLPVHRLLGGALRRRIPVTHSIGLIGFEEAEREVAQVVVEGIRTIKIKVGVDPDRDVKMVRRIRDTVGTGIGLCVDANQGYRTPGDAIRTLRRMERFDLIYFEQPVEGIERLAQVARAIDVPVMADESAWNAHDVIQIIELYRGFIRENPVLSEVMFAHPFTDFEASRSELRAAGAVRSFIVERVRRCIDAGLMHGEEADIALVLIALTEGLAIAEGSDRLGTTQESIDRRWALAVNAVLDGLSQ